jgi:hypothetical protein
MGLTSCSPEYSLTWICYLVFAMAAGFGGRLIEAEFYIRTTNYGQDVIA